MALVEYDHQWTIGERIIFDDAQEILKREISISSAGCMVSGLSDSGIFPSQTQRRGSNSCCDPSSVQLFLSGCSLRQVVLLLGRLAVSMLYRRLLVFCSYICVGEMRKRLIFLSNVRGQLPRNGGTPDA